MLPEWALRAYSPFWIVESLFVRATDDVIRHYDRLGPVTLDEFKDLVRDRRICPNIPVSGEPALQDVRIGVLFGQNPNRHFAGVFVIRSVERDCGDWIARKPRRAFFFSGESKRRLNLIKTSSV